MALFSRARGSASIVYFIRPVKTFALLARERALIIPAARGNGKKSLGSRKVAESPTPLLRYIVACNASTELDLHCAIWRKFCFLFGDCDFVSLFFNNLFINKADHVCSKSFLSCRIIKNRQATWPRILLKAHLTPTGVVNLFY